MILICFPEEVALAYDDGHSRSFLPFDPGQEIAANAIDPALVYLAFKETLLAMSRQCMATGRRLPVQLSSNLLNMLAYAPTPLHLFLKGKRDLIGKKAVRVCLFNGGGGGLGDGIMFAPALEILDQRLGEEMGLDVQLDVYTIFPSRTITALGHIPFVKVKRLPLSLAEYVTYDLYVDFSGMLEDAVFQNTHMTDYALHRMGIVPESVEAGRKEPFLPAPLNPPPEVVVGLKLARGHAGSRPLVAVIFRSSLTRTMPEDKAAELLGCLAAFSQPVLLMQAEFAPEVFVRRYNLADQVVDLSQVSTSFEHYIALLAGMDAIVSVDTSAVHIGGALRKPTVGVFNSINMAHRITYSPTVAGIQLQFSGRQCQAPCGLSKSSCFVQGTMPSGRSFRWEFGYSCDEAVDKDSVLAAAIEQLRSIDRLENEDDRMPVILKQANRIFLEAVSPCWQALDPRDVVSTLQRLLAQVQGTDTKLACPVCMSGGEQMRVGKWNGRHRYYCRLCAADFFAPQPFAAWQTNGRGLILPDEEEKRFVRGVLGQIFARSRSVLWIGTGRPDYDDVWRGDDMERCRFASWHKIATMDRTQRYEAVVAIGALDIVPEPREFLSFVVSLLAGRGFFVMATANQDSLVSRLTLAKGVGREFLQGPSWRPVTHGRFLEEEGLKVIWSESTPLTWTSVHETMGFMPSLRVAPPDLQGMVIELTGQDLEGTVRAHFARALKGIRGQGRFLVSCGRKGAEG